MRKETGVPRETGKLYETRAINCVRVWKGVESEQEKSRKQKRPTIE